MARRGVEPGRVGQRPRRSSAGDAPRADVADAGAVDADVRTSTLGRRLRARQRTCVARSRGVRAGVRAVAAVDAIGAALLQSGPQRAAPTSAARRLRPERPLLVESVEYTLARARARPADRRLRGPLARARRTRATDRTCCAPGSRAAATRRMPRRLSNVLAARAPQPVHRAVEPAIASRVARRLRAIALAPLDAAGADAARRALARRRRRPRGACACDDFIGAPASVFDDDDGAWRDGARPARARAVDEVALLAVPDIHIQPCRRPERAPLPDASPIPACRHRRRRPAVPRPPSRRPAAALRRPTRSTACRRRRRALRSARDRVALLDPPFDAVVRDPRLGVAGVARLAPALRHARSPRSMRRGSWSPIRCARARPRLGTALTRAMPPCGHVAGFFAATDLAIGVHKAPANGAADLGAGRHRSRSTTRRTACSTTSGINAIRAYPGRGLRVFGARTCRAIPTGASSTCAGCMLMIEKAIELSIQWAVFEPNDRLHARQAASGRSRACSCALWQRGALVGATAQRGVLRPLRRATQPARSARDRGELVAEVGVAPSKPFEFVVLRVGRAGESASRSPRSTGARRAEGRRWPPCRSVSRTTRCSATTS